MRQSGEYLSPRLITFSSCQCPAGEEGEMSVETRTISLLGWCCGPINGVRRLETRVFQVVIQSSLSRTKRADGYQLHSTEEENT